MTRSKVSIIILNWNRLNDTLECLDSCLKIDYPNHEILVFDNGSDENQAKIVAEKYQGHPQIKSIRLDKNYGFAEGNNIGIRKAFEDPNVKHIICLNNDTTVEPNFVSELVKTAQQGFDMVNAKVLSYHDHNKIDNLGMEVCTSMLTFNRKSTTTPLFCPTGCAVLYSRNLLESIVLAPQNSHKIRINSHKNSHDSNYFDANYFCYAEDFDLGFRALLQGFKPAVSEKAIVYHKGSVTTSVMSDFAIYHSYRNIVWTIIKNLPLPLFFRFCLKIKLGHWAIILLNVKRGKTWLILKAYLHAFLKFPKFWKKRKLIQKHKKISNTELLKYINKKIFSRDYL